MPQYVTHAYLLSCGDAIWLSGDYRPHSTRNLGGVRIGILSQWYEPESGGASIPGVLARGLSSRGHDVQVLTGFPNYPTGKIYDGYRQRVRQQETSGRVTVTRVPLLPSHDSSLANRAANYGSFALSASAFGLSKMRSLDALWVYSSPATIALPMWLLRYGAGVPVVLHNMDMWPDSVFAAGFAPAGASGRALHSALSRWCGSMYASAHAVAYVSPSAGAELHRRGVPESKLHYVPLWINEEIFRPATTTTLRQRLGIAEDEVVVLYAGALGKAQGIDALINAAIALPADVKLRVVVLGSGTEEGKIRALASTAPGRVIYLGTVLQTEMTEYMALGDIHFVSLAQSVLSEFTMPSKIPATFACRKPILLAASGDAKRVVDESRAGMSVAPGDLAELRGALLQVAALGREALAELGELARGYYDQSFAADRAVDQIDGLLESAAGASAGGRPGRMSSVAVRNRRISGAW